MAMLDRARKRVGILVFDDVEVLDFCGPFEVFSTCRREEARRREEPSPYEVVLIAERAGLVTASGGLRVVPDCGLGDCPKLDILVVPGGWGTRREAGNAALLGWIAEQARLAEITASVCTGAFLLAGAGLLDGRRATTHRGSIDRLRETFPAVDVVDDRRVVEDGAIFSSAGISAGIDLALRLVARDQGEAIARATAAHMEYPYPDDLGRPA